MSTPTPDIALEAIAYVRSHYDESIFPPRPQGPHSEVYDGEAASVARLTCDNILRELEERRAEAVPLTPPADDLDAIEERAKAVGTEPWDLPWCYEEGAVLDAHRDIVAETLDEDSAAFIVHAAEDIPALVAEVRALRASPTVEALAQALRGLMDAIDESPVSFEWQHYAPEYRDGRAALAAWDKEVSA